MINKNWDNWSILFSSNGRQKSWLSCWEEHKNKCDKGSSFDDLTRRFYWGWHFNRKLLCVRRTKTKNMPRIKSMFAWFVQECLDVQKEERWIWNDRETCFTILHIRSLNYFKNNKMLKGASCVLLGISPFVGHKFV